jgi:hypothetical protein
MSSFFSSLSRSKKNSYDTKKLSTLETLDKTLQKEITNIHKLLDEIENNIIGVHSKYTPDFHGEYIDVNERDSELNKLMNTQKELITRLQSFEKRMEGVSSSLPKQRTIKSRETETIRNKLDEILEKNLDNDVRNKVNEYIGELVLSNECVYVSSEPASKKPKWFGGKSRKQKKSRKTNKHK